MTQNKASQTKEEGPITVTTTVKQTDHETVKLVREHVMPKSNALQQIKDWREANNQYEELLDNYEDRLEQRQEQAIKEFEEELAENKASIGELEGKPEDEIKEELYRQFQEQRDSLQDLLDDPSQRKKELREKIEEEMEQVKGKAEQEYTMNKEAIELWEEALG